MSRPAASTEGTVRVVGTAHVSAESAREVAAAIDEERPDVVAVELDEDRYRQLKGETPDDVDPGDLLRGNTVFQFLAYWMLSYVQTRLGERFDVEPGADMLAAVETAEDLGIDVALVDRDIGTTIARFWARMGTLEKLRTVGALAFGVSDPRIAGVTFGLLVGLVAGPLLGLFGGAVGVTGPLLARVAGGVVLGAVAGLAVDLAGGVVLDPEDRTLAALAVGLGGAVLAAVLGVGDGLAARFLGDFLVGAVGSIALGLGLGVVVGLLAGAAVGALDLGPEEDVEEFDPADLTDADAVSAMLEGFREFSPGGAEALIDERDAFIAHKLVALRAAGRDVVAVVGAGHREGIERYLREPGALPPMESLTGRPDRGGLPWGKAVGLLLSVGFLGFFLLLAMAGVRSGFLLRLFAAWFLINGAFAFALAKLAGARWPSAAVGGAVAWMTSVNPLLAPGWFTGYMELRHTPVNVADIGRLNDLLSDEELPVRQILSEMFDVPLFRLIVIVAATNVGSVVASLLFAAYVLPLFAADLGGVEGVSRLMLRGARRSAEQLWGVLG